MHAIIYRYRAAFCNYSKLTAEDALLDGVMMKETMQNISSRDIIWRLQSLPAEKGLLLLSCSLHYSYCTHATIHISGLYPLIWNFSAADKPTLSSVVSLRGSIGNQEMYKEKA